ncbi:MAG: peptidase U32 family protein [Geothermobacteraceae bacterium]
MKLISPVDKLNEVEPLIKAGAGELYGGVMPPDWEKYGLLASVNQRTFAGAQFESLDSFLEGIAAAKDCEVPFFLTLNSPFYTDDQHPLLADLVARAAEAGLAGAILADPGLLCFLKADFPQLQYHASTLAHLGNAGAVRFYRRLGIDRAILPRHLSVGEMARVVAAVPDVGFDAFLLVGKCPNTEGLCTFHHSSQDKIWPCEIPYKINVIDGENSSNIEKAVMRQASWSRSNRRHGCGLCAIPHLAQAGLTGLKLVGRGAPLAMKLANLNLARDFLHLAFETDDFTEYRRQAVAAHARRFGSPCSPNVCYYPEFYLGE